MLPDESDEEAFSYVGFLGSWRHRHSAQPDSPDLGDPGAVGIGLDIFDRYGEAPIALALCVPVTFVLLRLVSPRALMRHFAAALSLPHLPLIGRPS
jgi:hypothetical protein